MTPDYGTSLRFTIEQDLGTRVALDEEFHFARIRLHTGEILPASFNERQFSKLKDERGEIRAAAVGALFSEAPAAYNTSDNIAFAERMDQKAVSEALDRYTAELLEYTQGRTKERPSFPDLQNLPHWKDDFKLRAAGAPLRDGEAVHLHLDPRDLKLSHAPNPQASHPWKQQSEYAQAVSIFRDISREFNDGLSAMEELTGKPATTFDAALLLIGAASVAVCKRIRNEKNGPRIPLLTAAGPKPGKRPTGPEFN